MRELHVTTPAMRGPDVIDLQNILSRLGYAPGQVDGIFGPTTAKALEAFQAVSDPEHKLAPEGTLTEALLAVLVEAYRALVAGGPPAVRPESTIGQAALYAAIAELGYKESPPYSNRTKYGQWFGLDGVKWCAIFASWSFFTGAGYVLCDGIKGAGVRVGKGCSYVPTIEAWLRTAGFWVGRTSPQPGDIVIFNFEHIGIVRSCPGEDHSNFLSVEGNTSHGNDSDGGEVMTRQRYLSQVTGFGRIV